jgi:hypothetical protein
MNTNSSILLPIVVLVAWTMVMWFWMYFTRIPAIIKMKLRLDSNIPRAELMNSLPPSVRWKADNYNHLMEQPTIFYAVAIVLAMIGEGEGVNSIYAWVYVSLRVVHSFVQSIGNNILLRFAVFVLSSIALLGLIVNALVALT